MNWRSCAAISAEKCSRPKLPPEWRRKKKYDVTVASMIATLRYGSGFPMHRLEKMQDSLGIPLPASVQWEIVAAAAIRITPVFDELIRQAAQGDVLHNDDTSMMVLNLRREIDIEDENE